MPSQPRSGSAAWNTKIKAAPPCESSLDMPENESGSNNADDLRKRAEAKTVINAERIPENLEALSPEEAKRMLHELRVHQIELEMQNEELLHAQDELETSQARYFDLYDLAPVPSYRNHTTVRFY